MVDGPLFQQLHDIAVNLRKPTPKPFGGIQVRLSSRIFFQTLSHRFQIIVTGDFFQLPPVTRNNQEPIFAFESPAWKNSLDCTVNLTHVFRQKDSGESYRVCSHPDLDTIPKTVFISALNTLRLGTPTEEATALFNSLSRPLPSSSILPTELYPLRAQVAQSNASRLNALPSPKILFVARDSGTRMKLLETLLAEERLELKVDAQVMLIKNVDEVLVNGVVGRVLGFYSPNQLIGGTPHSSSSSASPATLLASTGSRSTAAPGSGSGSASASSSKAPTSFRSPTETKKNGALLRYVRLSEDGKTPILASKGKENNPSSLVKVESKPKVDIKKETKGKEKATTVQVEEKYPLVLFEYPSQDGSGYGSEAVLIKRDEFKVEDAEGKLLARRVQVYVLVHSLIVNTMMTLTMI